MTIHPISKFLVSTDKVCDYLPVLSTVSNIVDLFFKCVVLPLKSQSSIQTSHYYTHLNQKSFGRCMVLLIPLIGQLAIALYDLKQTPVSSEQKLPELVLPPQDPKVPKPYRWHSEMETLALEAVQKKAANLLEVSPGLLNQDFLAKAIWNNPKVIGYLPPEAKDNEYLCSLAVLKKQLRALEHFNLPKEAILRMLEIEPDLDLVYIDRKLLDDERFVYDALQLNSRQAFALATPRIHANKDLALQGIYVDVILKNYIAKELLEDSDVKTAIECRTQTH